MDPSWVIGVYWTLILSNLCISPVTIHGSFFVNQAMVPDPAWKTVGWPWQPPVSIQSIGSKNNYQRPFKISLDVHGKNHWYSRYCIIQTPFCCVFVIFCSNIILHFFSWYQHILNIIQTHISLWYSVGWTSSIIGSRSSDVCPGVLRRHERTGAEVLRKAQRAGVLSGRLGVFMPSFVEN
jgi:hypothetical protein